MRLDQMRAQRYRSLRDVTLDVGPLTVLIGTNASGKSNILDALRFLAVGVREKDFRVAVGQRGGLLSLAWKGDFISDIRLTMQFSSDSGSFEWILVVRPGGMERFTLDERLWLTPPNQARTMVLFSEGGQGFWSSEEGRQVPLAQGETECALAAAAADRSFPGREIAEFVAGWGFFDPSPWNLRRIAADADSSRLDAFGRNLASRLRAVREASPQTFDQILSAMQRILGTPEKIELRQNDLDEWYFVQEETGLRFPVHQIGASSGTLRMLALVTALLGESQSGLIGVEEPENYVHPSALADFAQYLTAASIRLQVLVTTHSPLLLDSLEDPGAVVVVRRDEEGTQIIRESQPDDVRKALVESGFMLGEYHRARGFGG
jgi:predicted ATPase